MKYATILTSALYFGCAAPQVIVDTPKPEVVDPCIKTFEFAGRKMIKNICEPKGQEPEPINIPIIEYDSESITDILKNE